MYDHLKIGRSSKVLDHIHHFQRKLKFWAQRSYTFRRSLVLFLTRLSQYVSEDCKPRSYNQDISILIQPDSKLLPTKSSEINVTRIPCCSFLLTCWHANVKHYFCNVEDSSMKNYSFCINKVKIRLSVCGYKAMYREIKLKLAKRNF